MEACPRIVVKQSCLVKAAGVVRRADSHGQQQLMVEVFKGRKRFTRHENPFRAGFDNRTIAEGEGLNSPSLGAGIVAKEGRLDRQVEGALVLRQSVNCIEVPPVRQDGLVIVRRNITARKYLSKGLCGQSHVVKSSCEPLRACSQ